MELFMPGTRVMDGLVVHSDGSNRLFAVCVFFDLIKGFWCRRPESNRHDPYGSADFKSAASTNSATPAGVVLLMCRIV